MHPNHRSKIPECTVPIMKFCPPVKLVVSFAFDQLKSEFRWPVDKLGAEERERQQYGRM